jgi:type IV pilus assembly protein PilW
MNHFVPHLARTCGRAQRGLTLIELMIALTVSLFLLGGLLKIVQSTRSTFGDQNALAQMQDNERLAMTFMTDVIESAGYFPNPKVNGPSTVFPAVGTTFAAGQAIYGTTNASPVGDTVTVRYAAASGDNAFNCMGTTNTSGALDTFVNKFWVDSTNPQNPVLTCTFSSNTTASTPVVLVNNVKSLAILYGVKRNAANTGSCTDTYLTAAQMAAADWSAMCSVMVTLTFPNPLDSTKPAISISRVIAVMNTAGANT